MPDLDFERRVAAAIRAPVSIDEHAKARVMERVRAAASTARPRRPDGARPFGAARHSIVGLALAAGIGSVTTLSVLMPGSGTDAARAASATVIGDSVVSTLRDTLRLVRLIFHDDGARRVAVVGDFNGWRENATPLRRGAGSPRWSVLLALHEGEHRYAFVVDGTRWVPDGTRGTEPVDGRQLYGILRVARVSN